MSLSDRRLARPFRSVGPSGHNPWITLLRSFLILVLIVGTISANASTDISGGLSGELTWSPSGSPYLIHGPTIVGNGSRLTVQPGTLVQFDPGTYLQVQSGGELKAEGTDAARIQFTSAKASPAPGDWRGLFVDGGAKVQIGFAEIAFAGAGSEQAILVNDTRTVLHDLTIRDGASIGIHLQGGAAAPQLSGIAIKNFTGPAVVLDTPELAPSYANLSLSGNHPDGVVVSGSGINRNTAWTLTGHPYFVNNALIVGNGTKWSISPGAVLRMLPGAYVQIQNGATFDAVGTADAPVKLTSAAVSPRAGDWRGLFLDGGSSVHLAFAEISFGGAAGEQAISAGGSGVHLENVAIHNSAGIGVHVVNGPIQPAFQGLTVLDCAGPAIVHDSPEATPAYAGLSLKNNHPDGLVVGGGGINRATRWDVVGYPYFVSGPLIVGNGIAFSLSPGVELRMVANGYIQVQNGSTLTLEGTDAQPIRLTSQSQPGAPGDWRGLFLDGGSTASLSFLDVGYAGTKGEQAISVGTGSASLRRVTVHDSAGIGVHVINGGIAPLFAGLSIVGSAAPALVYDSTEAAPIVQGLSLSGNHPDGIVLGGGGLNHSRKWAVVGYPYFLTGPVIVENQALCQRVL